MDTEPSAPFSRILIACSLDAVSQPSTQPAPPTHVLVKLISCFLLCLFISACGHPVTISYSRSAVVHPAFDQPYTTWNGERVQIDWTPSLRAESFKYLVKYDQALLANSIRQRGLRNEYKIAGKGTPLVVFVKNPESTTQERHYPAGGIAIGITAVEEERQGQVPLLKLYDPFDPLVVRASTGTDPIAANYTAPLAVLDSHATNVAGSATASFLRPDNPRFATGIYLIHPYDPNKIPILFIHGLISSPLSWQNLVNDLCADPKILEHYQPWFFLYPTGQPALESAAQLRADLQETQRLFDPNGAAVPSHHIVVVAHSMGGLLAHTLVSDSGDALWDAFATRPFEGLSLPPEVKEPLLSYFFFRHQPCIDRVIFLAVPHRGSGLASGLIGSVGSRVMRHSKDPSQSLRKLAAEYPGILNPYYTKVNARGGPTSLFSLAPNPLYERLADLPIKVPFHSIIGNLGEDDGTYSTDGVVSYRSAHLEGAESELVVPAGHVLISHPGTVAEIKRILEKNIAEKGNAPGRALRSDFY
jgi:pimeloyl-ACP methyl ester carboxylesterase